MVESADLTLGVTQPQAQLVPTQMTVRKSQLHKEKDKASTKGTMHCHITFTLCIHLYISYYIPDYIGDEGDALAVALHTYFCIL